MNESKINQSVSQLQAAFQRVQSLIGKSNNPNLQTSVVKIESEFINLLSRQSQLDGFNFTPDQIMSFINGVDVIPEQITADNAQVDALTNQINSLTNQLNAIADQISSDENGIATDNQNLVAVNASIVSAQNALNSDNASITSAQSALDSVNA